jgi:hypothetical protein
MSSASKEPGVEAVGNCRTWKEYRCEHGKEKPAIVVEPVEEPIVPPVEQPEPEPSPSEEPAPA